MTLSAPARFRPVELKYALDRLYLHQTVKLSKLDEMRNKIVKVQHSDVKIPFADSYSVVKGRINVYLKTIEALKQSQTSVSMMLSAQGLTRFRCFPNMMNTIRSRARRGVEFRIIAQVNSRNIDDAKTFSKFCEVRHVNNQFTNASVYDERIGSIALSLNETLDVDEAEHVSFWTTANGFVGTLVSYINSAWFIAAPLDLVKVESDLESSALHPSS